MVLIVQLILLSNRITASFPVPAAQGDERVAAAADEGGEIQARIDMLAHRLTRQPRHAHTYRGDDGNVVVLHARHPRVALAALVGDKLEH